MNLRQLAVEIDDLAKLLETYGEGERRKKSGIAGGLFEMQDTAKRLAETLREIVGA